MSMKTAAAGAILYSAFDKLVSFDLLVKGSVTVSYPNGEIVLEKGDILGIIDICSEVHRFTYTASSDVTMLSYPFDGVSSFSPLLKSNKDLSVLLAASMTKQLCQLIDHFVFVQFESDNLYHFILDSYNDYKSLCTKYSYLAKTLPEFDSMSPIDTENTLPPFISAYYDNIRELSIDDCRTLFQKNLGFAGGYLLKAGEDVTSCLLLCEEYTSYNDEMSYFLLNEDGIDFFDLFTELYCKTISRGKSDSSLMAMISKLMIYLEGLPSINSEFYTERTTKYQSQIKHAESLFLQKNADLESHRKAAKEVSGSLDIILDYAACPPEITQEFKSGVLKYRSMIDKSSTDDEYTQLLKHLTSLFYEIYSAAFFKSLDGFPIPPILKMFFLFGYVDEILAGVENSLYLHSYIDSFKGNPSKGIYTTYEWLLAIYNGQKEPSRNEFDSDYAAYVHDLKVAGKITATTEASMLSDSKEKLLFELQNMFPCVNKIVFGRITNYCPLLSEHNILKSLEDALLSSEKIEASLSQLRSSDYTVFYRESIYVNKECDLTKEFIQTEILPDIIWMPSIGTRGSMWQEIEGKRRNTPARFMLPILCLTDSTAILTRLTAEYRWEMCKRVQGSRWNDVSERSLTSEYVDYIQFYRKNHDLSVDAKAKVKLSLTRFRNSFKECFVQDYMDFMQYESKGSPRLNKVSRAILFSHCPFTLSIREQLSSNPLYNDCLNRHNVKQGQLLYRHDLLIKKLISNARDIPPEISAQEFYLKG